MPPESRALLAVLCLAIFGWTLTPRAAAPVARDEQVEQLLVVSRKAFDTKNWQAALAPTAALVERYPNQQVFAARLARIHAALGQPAEEVAAWERFLRVSPTPEDACPAVSEAYHRAGDHAAALETAIRCRDFDPLNGELHYYLGRAYERADQPDQARQAYEEALRVEPPHVDTRVALAGMLLRDGLARQALEVIQGSVPVNPDNADVLLVFGIALQRLGQRVEARRALEHAATLSPDYADIHLVLGVLDFSEGRTRDARRRFERVRQLDPGRRDVDVWLERTKGAL